MCHHKAIFILIYSKQFWKTEPFVRPINFLPASFQQHSTRPTVFYNYAIYSTNQLTEKCATFWKSWFESFNCSACGHKPFSIEINYTKTEWDFFFFKKKTLLTFEIFKIYNEIRNRWKILEEKKRCMIMIYWSEWIM